MLVIAAPPASAWAKMAGAGWLYDPRLCFRPNFSATFPVPTAYVEEILLRTMRSLVMWVNSSRPPVHLDDRVHRTDDLRLLLSYEPDETISAARHAVRSRLVELVSTQQVPIDEYLYKFTLAISDQVKKTAQTNAVPSSFRPSHVSYTDADRSVFIARMGLLLDALREG